MAAEVERACTGTADWVPADVMVERKASTVSLGSLVIVEPDQDSGGSSPTLTWRPGQQPSESLGEAAAQQGEGLPHTHLPQHVPAGCSDYPNTSADASVALYDMLHGMPSCTHQLLTRTMLGMPSSVRQLLARTVQFTCILTEANTTTCVRGAGGGAAAGKVERAEEAQRASGVGVQMLEALRELPWRRIDVCFKGTSMPFFAHNLIQVRAAHSRRHRGSSTHPQPQSVRSCDGCCTNLCIRCACTGAVLGACLPISC